MKIVIISVVGLLLLGSIGFGIYWYFFSKEDEKKTVVPAATAQNQPTNAQLPPAENSPSPAKYENFFMFERKKTRSDSKGKDSGSVITAVSQSNLGKCEKKLLSKIDRLSEDKNYKNILKSLYAADVESGEFYSVHYAIIARILNILRDSSSETYKEMFNIERLTKSGIEQNVAEKQIKSIKKILGEGKNENLRAEKLTPYKANLIASYLKDIVCAEIKNRATANNPLALPENETVDSFTKKIKNSIPFCSLEYQTLVSILKLPIFIFLYPKDKKALLFGGEPEHLKSDSIIIYLTSKLEVKLFFGEQFLGKHRSSKKNKSSDSNDDSYSNFAKPSAANKSTKGISTLFVDQSTTQTGEDDEQKNKNKKNNKGSNKPKKGGNQPNNNKKNNKGPNKPKTRGKPANNTKKNNKGPNKPKTRGKPANNTKE